MFTVVVTFVVGALWLPPDAFRQLAKEASHALLSISNIQYWRESKQYFAAASDQLALLHCWSLSLEEQFYLFWPALLFWAFRLGRLGIVISLAATVSFTLSIVELSTDAQAAFFLTPFRIFEFSIGTSIIFIEEKSRVSNRIAESIAIVGMLAIAVSYSLFTSTMPFPGFAVLLPCVDVASSRLPVFGAKELLLLVGVCGSCARSKAAHRNVLPWKRRPALRTPQRMALGGQATGLPAACPCDDDRARGVRDDDRARGVRAPPTPNLSYDPATTRLCHTSCHDIGLRRHRRSLQARCLASVRRAR